MSSQYLKPEEMQPGQTYQIEWEDCCTTGEIRGVFESLDPDGVIHFQGGVTVSAGGIIIDLVDPA